MKTPIEVRGGWLNGHLIRTCRKPFRCDYNHGRVNGGRCKRIVEPGHLYVEGDVDPYRAGGFASYRYCFACAGPEVRQTVADREVRQRPQPKEDAA